MARALFSGEPLGSGASFDKHSETFWFPAMPKLQGKLGLSYSSQFPERMKLFQAAQDATAAIQVVVDRRENSSSSWSHSLYHDAESVFWMLVWWIVNAIPVGHTTR